MKTDLDMKKLAYSLILIPILLITLRVVSGGDTDRGVISATSYQITYHHQVKGGEYFNVEFQKPVENFRQEITIDPIPAVYSKNVRQGSTFNQNHVWQGVSDVDTTLTYRLSAKTKSTKFDIDSGVEIELSRLDDNLRYIEPPIGSQPQDHPLLRKVSTSITPDTTVKVKDLAAGFFEYVEQIPTAKNSMRGDALSCQEQAACSEEAKNRLLISLFQSAGIPARLAGGLVLDESKKVGLDYWMQANIGDQWVTFDPERDHFATLPATHLELFSGESLPSNEMSPSTTNAYYEIEKERDNDYSTYALFNIWSLIDANELPFRPIMILLLLPLGAYIVAICTNVIGFKTYGVFLPVLIAFAFINMGLLQGLLFFTVIIGLISLMSFPLERWGILHTPKIVCLLTAVGLYCLAAVKLFYITGWVTPSATLTFPVIILTLIAERFAQKVEEESLNDALFIYFQTLLVTIGCYLILSASVIQHAFITFPELLMGIAGLSLLLGKWIGLQLFEYSRFSKIDEEVSYAK